MAALRTAQRRSIVGSSDARLESVHAHDGSLIGRRTHPLEMEAVEDECEMIAAASVGDGGLSICTHLPSAHGSAASTMSRPSMGADGQDGEGMLSSWAGDSVVEDMYVHHSCSSSRPSSVKRVNSTKIETSPTSLHRRRGSNHALASTTTNNNNNSNPSMLVMANNSTSTAPKTNSLHSRGTDAEHHGSGARVHRLSGNRNSSSRPPLGPTKVVAGGSSSSTTLHGRNNATTYVESLSADTAMANILLPSSTSHSSIGSLPSKTSSALPPPLATVSVGVLRSNLSLISPFSRRPRAGSASTSSAAAVEEAEDLLTATVSMVDDTTLGDAVHHHHHPPHHHHAQQHPLSGALRRRELRTGSDASVDDMAPLALPPSPVSSTSRHFNGSLTAAGREDGDPLMLLLHHEEDEVDVEDEGGSTTIGRSQQHTRSPAHVYGMSFGASAEDLVGEVLIAVDDGELMPPSPSSAAVVADDVQGCSIVHELPGLIPAAISTTTYVSHQPTLANNNNNTSARHARAEVRRMDGGSNNAV